MKRVPEGRDTTGQGRASGPKPEELPGRCSVPGPSSAIAKCFSLPAIPAIRGFYLRFSVKNRWLLLSVVTRISVSVTRFLVRFSRYRERVLTVRAISSISSWSSQSTGGRGGHFPSGRGRREHPNGATECRMGESPARPEAAPGTQGAERPSSFRRGREGARFRGTVPSAGWREVAESCHATEGQSHE